MATTPYARVAYLLGIPEDELPIWQRTRTGVAPKTPTTLTGHTTAISSYQLCIAYKKAEDWYVYDHKNSPTTNRHLSAVRGVLESQGYTATDETTVEHGHWSRSATYRKYVKG
jgi:hypothetical protein